MEQPTRLSGGAVDRSNQAPPGPSRCSGAAHATIASIASLHLRIGRPVAAALQEEKGKWRAQPERLAKTGRTSTPK